MRAPVVDLDTSVGYLLKEASTALRLEMERMLRPLGLTVTAYSCLEILAQRPGSSNSDLARGAFVTRQSMNVLLQSLEEEGLVSKAARAPVGKALPVRLTAHGRARLEKASAAVRAVEIRMLSGLGASDQAAIVTSLRSIVGALRDTDTDTDSGAG